MDNGFTIILSSGEIYVLAALLGYSSVFGIEDKTLNMWRSSIRQNVKNVMTRLEKRMIVLFELDGNICWQQSMEIIIHCICSPDVTGMITHISDTGRVTKKWLFSKNRNTVIMSKIAADAYKLSFSDNAIEDTVAKFFNNAASLPLNITMPYKKAQAIRKKLNSFDRDMAEEIADSYADSSENISVLIDLLSGNCKTLSIHGYVRKKEYYSSNGNCIIVNTGKNVVRLKLDNNILHFDSVSEDEVKREFKRIAEMQ